MTSPTTEGTEPTDQPPAGEPASSTPVVPPPGTEPDDHDGDDDGRRDTGKEAAKYRRQLRDTEAERDTLRTQLAAARQQMVEGVSGLAKPGALWAAGVDVHSLFDEHGRMDTEKVQTTVAEQVDRLGLAQQPHWVRFRLPKPDPSQGKGGDTEGGDGRTNWRGAFKKPT